MRGKEIVLKKLAFSFFASCFWGEKNIAWNSVNILVHTFLKPFHIYNLKFCDFLRGVAG